MTSYVGQLGQIHNGLSPTGFLKAALKNKINKPVLPKVFDWFRLTLHSFLIYKQGNGPVSNTSRNTKLILSWVRRICDIEALKE